MRYLLVLSVLFALGCEDKAATHPVYAKTGGRMLDSLSINEVYPTSGPGVYMDAGSRLWYVEGATGMAVRTPNGQTIDPCEVVPTSGRGVYVSDCAGDSYWYVVGAQAFNIHEVAHKGAMDTVPSELGTVVWAYVERARRERDLRELGEELEREGRDPRY